MKENYFGAGRSRMTGGQQLYTESQHLSPLIFIEGAFTTYSLTCSQVIKGQ